MIHKNADGSYVVPARAAADDGTIGDGYRTVKPGDPDYPTAERDYEKEAPRREAAQPAGISADPQPDDETE